MPLYNTIDHAIFNVILLSPLYYIRSKSLQFCNYIKSAFVQIQPTPPPEQELEQEQELPEGLAIPVLKRNSHSQ